VLEHGGRLRAAAAHYGIPLADWLDLSTGINPQAWPVPPIPADAWLRLPEEDDGLNDIAAAYYGCAADCLLPLPGSQAAIQLLPRLLAPTEVALLQPTYAEHPAAWRAAGHRVSELPAEALLASSAKIIVLAQPNNPTGSHYPPAELLAVAERQAARGGFLLIDEAFIDATPELSLAAHAGRPGLVILRSLGKFFGLAGARVGFLLAAPELLAATREALGPWPLSGPARYASRLALADRAWQQAARRQLLAASARLAELLAPLASTPTVTGTALFRWLPQPRSAAWQQQLAQRGILVRHFDQLSALRFGLPGTAAEWQRLEHALTSLAE
jgi:L-threonine-O-3-phosphate decarboxylase